MRTMTRREFTAYLGGVSAALGLPGCGLFRTGADSYSVPVLGDMHYDAFPREKFHAKAMRLWAEKGGVHPERILEFDRNAKMWQDLCKRILESSAAVRRGDAAFLLQLGDLVQGDCEDNALHTGARRSSSTSTARGSGVISFPVPWGIMSFTLEMTG